MKLPITFQQFTNIVLIGIILFLTLCSKPTVIINEGISEEEFKYRIKVLELTQANQTLQNEIINFKESLIKDSVFVSHASNEQIDSLFTNYFR